MLCVGGGYGIKNSFASCSPKNYLPWSSAIFAMSSTSSGLTNVLGMPCFRNNICTCYNFEQNFLKKRSNRFFWIRFEPFFMNLMLLKNAKSTFCSKLAPEPAPLNTSLNPWNSGSNWNFMKKRWNRLFWIRFERFFMKCSSKKIYRGVVLDHFLDVGHILFMKIAGFVCLIITNIVTSKCTFQ